MLKSVENLIKGATNQGNHTKEINGNITKYMYHGNTICKVNTIERTVHYDFCGWHTTSTTRAINSYKQAFSNYTEI